VVTWLAGGREKVAPAEVLDASTDRFKDVFVVPLRCIQKFPDWVDNEIYAYKIKHPLRSNIKGYVGKTHYTGSQNSDTTAPSGRELYHLLFLLQAASPETFRYTFLYCHHCLV
jgi:hypothetical protein